MRRQKGGVQPLSAAPVIVQPGGPPFPGAVVADTKDRTQGALP